MPSIELLTAAYRSDSAVDKTLRHRDLASAEISTMPLYRNAHSTPLGCVIAACQVNIAENYIIGLKHVFIVLQPSAVIHIARVAL